MKNQYINYPDQIAGGDIDHCSILFIDDKGVIKNWNRGAEHIEGYKPEEIIGTNFSVLFTDEDRLKKIPEQLMKDAIKSGKVCQSGWRVRKDGSLFWADAEFTALFDDHKKIIGFSEIIHDISEVRNYIDFEQSNLNALINNIKDELWSVDREYRLITANEAYNKLLITLSGKAISRGGELLETNFSNEQILRFKEYYDRVFAGESFTTLEITSSPIDHIAEISFSPICKGEEIVGAACRASDITEKRKEELKQQQIDRRFRALIENSKDGIAILTIEGKPLYISPTVEKTLGYSNEELMKSDLFAIMNPDFIPAEIREMEQCLANPGVAMEGQAVQMRHKDGSWRWMQGVKTNLLHDEAINGIVLNFSDITDIYLAEEKLKHSEARLHQAQEIAHLGTSEINFSTGAAIWSDEHCKIFGLGPGNNIQSYTLWMTFIHPEDFKRVLMTIDKAEAAGGSFELDYRILLKDKSIRYIHSVCHLDADNTGKKTGLYAVITDETEVKESQQKLMYANRLLSFKSEINKTLGEKNDEQSLLNRACELAVNYGKFDVAWINKPDVVNKKINFIASYNITEFETTFFKNFIHYDETGPTGTALRTGKPHVVNNFAYWSHYGARHLYAAEKGFKSAIALPVKMSGEIVYTLNLFSKQPEIFNDGEVALLIEAAADISFALDFVHSEYLRIETELNLQKSENKFRALIENSDDAMAIFSAEGKLRYVSNSAQKILGYSVEEAKAIDFLTIIHPDFHMQNMEVMREVLQNPGVPVKRFAKLMKHKNGSWRWIESTMTNLLHEPSVCGIIDNFTDITDRKIAEESLKFSEKRLRQAQEIAHVGSWEIDQSTRIISLSEEACRIYGLDLSVHKITYDEWLSYLHPDESADLLQSMEDAKRGLTDASFFHKIILKDGTVSYIHMLTHCELNEAGDVNTVYGVSQDITELRLAEEKLIASESRFRSLIENSSDGVGMFNSEGTLTYVAPTVKAILGYTDREMLGMDLASVIHPEEWEARNEFMEKVMANPGLPISGFIKKMRHKDGRWLWIESTMTNMLENPAVGAIVDNYRDITGRKIAEEEILHANQLYTFISELNHIIVYSEDEKSLFKEACRLAVEMGSFRTAWIGMVNESENTFNLVEHSAMTEEVATLFRNVTYHPDGPVGIALKTGEPCVCDFELQPGLAEWKLFAREQHWRSYMVIPIKHDGSIIATFNLCAEQAEYFNEEICNLLKVAAEDISFAIGVFEKNRHRLIIEQQLSHSEMRMKQAQEIAHFGHWELDLATMVLDWSEEACRIMGVPVTDNIHSFEDWLSYIYPDDLERVKTTAAVGIANSKDENFYYRIIRRDGTVRHIYTIARFEFNESGVAVRAYGASHDVTEISESEEKLRYSEMRLKEAQELAHVGSWELELKSFVITMSEEACRIYGFPPENNTILFSQLLNYIHPDDLEFALESIDKAKKAHDGFSDFFHRILRSDGSVRFVHILAYYETDKQGIPLNLIGTLQDVTDIMLAEEKLKANEHRFRSMIENSAGGIMILSADRKPVYVSPSVKHIMGYTAEEFINLDLEELIHPDDRGGIRAVHQEVLNNPGKPIQSLPSRRHHKDGSWRWVDTVVTNLLHDPAVNGIVNNFRDITDKKLTDDALEYQNLRLIQAQEIANYGSAEMNYATREVIWSDQLCRIHGFKPGEGGKVFTDWLKIIHPDDLEYVMKTIGDADAAEISVTFSHRIIRPDGNVRYVQSRRIIERNSENKPVGIYSVVQDITESVLAEQKLKANEHRFRSLIENSAGGVGIMGANGKTVYVAPSVTKVLGYSVEEFMKMDIFSIIHPDDIVQAGKVIENAFQNPGLSFQGHTGRMKHKDGSWRWIDAIITNMLHDPAINGIVDNFRDITEKKLADDKLICANRLYAFISEVNHAIIHNNNEQELFVEVCRIAIEIGKFKMAWVGLLNENKDKILPLLCAGEGCDYVNNLEVVIDINDPKGKGPSGTAIRENRIVYSNDISADPGMEPWRENALKHGFNSSVAIPLRKRGIVIGAVTLYSGDINVFDDDEIKLVEDVAADISFALDIFENENLRTYLTRKLKQNELLLLRAQEVANFGSYEADFTTHIGVWSEQFCHIFGISPANNIQNYDKWLSFVHPDDKERVEQIIRESNTSGKNVNFHYRILRSDGSVRHIYSYRQIEFNSQGIPSGAFVVAHDITDEIAHIARLEQQDKQLTEIAWLQSHIVRAPVANILGLCQLVDYETLDPGTRELFTYIYESSGKLDHVIREIVAKTRQHDQGINGYSIPKE